MKTLALITSCSKEVDKWDKLEVPNIDHLIICGDPDLESNYIVEGKVLYVKCRDTYDGLPEKIICALNAFKELFPKNEYTHILKIDSDAHIGKNFNINVKQVTDNDYIGKVKFNQGSRNYHFGRVGLDSHWFNKKWNGNFKPFLCGGSSYILSSKSVDVITSYYGFDEVHNDKVYTTHITEDSMIGIILDRGGIKPTVYNYGVSRPEDRDKEAPPDIDMVYYINLSKRGDRRRHMEKLLKRCGLPYQRKSAIKPTKEDLIFDHGKYNHYYKRVVDDRKPWIENEYEKRFIGMMGVYISHIEILNDIKKKGYKRVLVLEDDVRFNNRSLDIIKNYIISGTIGPNWDMIRSLWRNTVPKNKKVVRILDPHRYSKFKRRDEKVHNITGGAHFTLINGDKIDKILDYVNQELIYDIDGVYSTNQLCVVCGWFEVVAGMYGTDIPKGPDSRKKPDIVGVHKRNNGADSVKKPDIIKVHEKNNGVDSVKKPDIIKVHEKNNGVDSVKKPDRNLVVQIFFDNKLITNNPKTHTNHNRGPLITSRMIDHKIFEDSQRITREYAKKCGADYILFDEPVIDFFSASMERMRIIEEEKWAKDYDNILYIDCDTIISDKCPNLFEEYPQKTLRVCPTLMSQKWLIEKESTMIQKFGQEKVCNQYFNGGVILFHSSTLDLMRGKLKYRERFNTYAFDDQSELNWVALEHDIPMTMMSRTYNSKPGTNVMISHFLGTLKNKYRKNTKREITRKKTSIQKPKPKPKVQKHPSGLIVLRCSELNQINLWNEGVESRHNELIVCRNESLDRPYQIIDDVLYIKSNKDLFDCNVLKIVSSLTTLRKNTHFAIIDVKKNRSKYFDDIDYEKLKKIHAVGDTLRFGSTSTEPYIVSRRSINFCKQSGLDKNKWKAKLANLGIEVFNFDYLRL